MDDTKEVNNQIENQIEEITSLVSSKETVNNDFKDPKEEKLVEFKLDNLNLSKSNVINILEDLRVIKKRFSHIENIIKEAEKSQYSPSRDLPGINGLYNGEYMLTTEGTKYDVPKNYAAKSLLVNGDELKMMEQDGKFAFKIVNKVPRKKIEGLLSKKDGKFVILSDSGTFNLLKTAVEFRNIKQGEWVLAFIPETGSHNNFAALDKVIKKEVKKEVKFFEKPKQESPKQSIKPDFNSSSSSQKVNYSQKNSQPKPAFSTNQNINTAPKSATPTAPSPMPKIQFSDDDLI
jgi:hypothetical protein